MVKKAGALRYALARTGEVASQVFPMGVGVAPVLDPAPAAGNDVIEERDVADRVDVLDRGAEVVVDHDPVLDLDRAAGEEVDDRLDAHSHDREEGLDRAARGGAGAGQHAAVRLELLDLLTEQSSTPCSR